MNTSLELMPLMIEGESNNTTRAIEPKMDFQKKEVQKLIEYIDWFMSEINFFADSPKCLLRDLSLKLKNLSTKLKEIDKPKNNLSESDLGRIDLDKIMKEYKKVKYLWGTKLAYGVLYPLVGKIPQLVRCIKELERKDNSKNARS